MADAFAQPGGVFFFSSRRRHTRCLSDWSSDVCSSDLGARRSAQWMSSHCAGRAPWVRKPSVKVWRSEERRVGKESRYREAPGEKKEHTNRKARAAYSTRDTTEAALSLRGSERKTLSRA